MKCVWLDKFKKCKNTFFVDLSNGIEKLAMEKHEHHDEKEETYDHDMKKNDHDKTWSQTAKQS